MGWAPGSGQLHAVQDRRHVRPRRGRIESRQLVLIEEDVGDAAEQREVVVAGSGDPDDESGQFAVTVPVDALRVADE